MGKWDDLYTYAQMADEQRKKENFNAFMDGLDKGLTSDLDNAYASGDMKKYDDLVSSIKTKTGARVFRNSEGKHKLKF
jgi:hypothetical protein